MRSRQTHHTGDHFVRRSTVRASTWNIRRCGLKGSVVRSAADYDTEGPNDHKFFSELGVFEKNLGTIFVTSTIDLGEVYGETSVPSVDYLVRGKVYRKPLSIGRKQPRQKTKEKEAHGEVRPRLDVEVIFTSTKRTLERGTDVVITSPTTIPARASSSSIIPKSTPSELETEIPCLSFSASSSSDLKPKKRCLFECLFVRWCRSQL